MAIIRRVRSNHTGLPGSPYLTTFNFLQGVVPSQAQDLNDAVEAFWTRIRNAIASPWTVLNDPEVYALDEATGDLVTSAAISRTATTAGGSASEWTAKQGLVTMRTGRYLRGRRVLGHLYVPGVASGSGEQVPTTAYETIVNTAVNGLITDSNDLGTPWCVYSRPTSDTASDGIGSAITSGALKGYWGVLRSRRQ